MTAIEWTEATWNPTTGCDRVSPGCENCYALTMAKRLQAMGSAKYQRDGNPLTSGPGFGLTTHQDALGLPLRWSRPRRVFVNSMSDLFHAEAPVEFIARVFAVMAATPQHTYQILTKRHARMRSVLSDVCRCGHGHAPGVHFRSQMAWAVSRANPDRIPGLPHDAEHRVYHEAGWPLPNVWLGVSAEDQQWADIRVPALLDTPAAVRFVSAEPLLGPVDLTPYLDRVEYQGSEYRSDVGHIAWYGPRLGWVIAGGESGPRSRLMNLDWARDLRDQCDVAGVPFFFKQAGSVLARRWGCSDAKGHNPAEWPEPFPRDYPTRVGGAG